ncbi:MAG: hypothetical protein KF777_16065 [Planctomycetaceae bacterium]|nr:hypothetical protein [Planctomycetaceae bacterium]
MTLSAEQQSFVDAIRKPMNSHRASLLNKRFDAIPREERFGALLHLFTSAHDYAAQQECSRFLPEVLADCVLPLDCVLRQIASTWNLSVEELPNFLAKVYGVENVIETCGTLELQYGDDTYERRALNTIAWWLKPRLNQAG